MPRSGPRKGVVSVLRLLLELEEDVLPFGKGSFNLLPGISMEAVVNDACPHRVRASPSILGGLLASLAPQHGMRLYLAVFTLETEHEHEPAWP
jgi:hypothetical protein